MSNAAATEEVTFSCYACAYAHPLAIPFDDWIWCEHPIAHEVLNLAREADCRREGGGRVPAAARSEAENGERSDASERE